MGLHKQDMEKQMARELEDCLWESQGGSWKYVPYIENGEEETC